MMTWTSLKSGSASSGVRFTATIPAAIAATVKSSTMSLFATDHSMMRLSIVLPVLRRRAWPRCGSRGSNRARANGASHRLGDVHARHVSHAAEHGSEVALRIDEESGRRDNRIAGGEPRENLHLRVVRNAEYDRVRLEHAVAPLHEHQAALAR